MQGHWKTWHASQAGLSRLHLIYHAEKLSVNNHLYTRSKTHRTLEGLRGEGIRPRTTNLALPT
jgi:hypothetical protein